MFGGGAGGVAGQAEGVSFYSHVAQFSQVWFSAFA